jgi:microfibrillar-associated protein 1
VGGGVDESCCCCICEKEEQEVVTDDDDDEEAEFEAWKVRELARIKRERDAKEAADKAAEERERLKNMTEEERAAWELANPKVQSVKEKQKWNFMQKYWHKGAYFQEATDGKDQTGKDEIFRSSTPPPPKFPFCFFFFFCILLVESFVFQL